MAARHAPLDALPRTFPIFPLTGAVLLPHARLPLNIFEPRYLAMTEDALAAGRLLAMIQPRSAVPDGPTGPALQRVGCLGRIVAFSEAEGHRFLITLGGIIRFTVAEELDMVRGYRRVRGNVDQFTDDLLPPEQAAAAHAVDRAALLQAANGYFIRQGINANLPALEAMPDAAMVLTLAMGCPFTPQEKQALLEASGPVERVHTLLALLRIDMHQAGGDDTRRPS